MPRIQADASSWLVGQAAALDMENSHLFYDTLIA
jgi:hypothetical protein